MVKKVLAGCTISLFGRNPAWKGDQHNKVAGWLNNLSGKLNTSFGPNTTHLIVSKKRWDEDPKPAVLQKALDEMARGRDLKIVTFEWLEDTLNAQSRKREGPYEFVRMEEAAAKVSAKNKKAAEKEEKRAAKSVPGILSEVFHESTAKFVDPIEKEKLDRKLEREKEERRARDMEAKEEKVRRRKEQAKIFARGANKARSHLMSDNYHIYQDNTGFKYDVLITKIDVRQNKNERFALTLQLYEENRPEPPFTYAMNAQFSGTSVATANNVIAAQGVNYCTAFHAFKSEFKRLTGMHWDERISEHIKRIRQEKLDRGVGTGSPAPGSVRGAPVPESATGELTFDEKKFLYHPPGYGPKGEVTPEEKARLKVLGYDVVDGTKRKRAPAVVPFDKEFPEDTRSVVEEWMKGADTSAISSPPKSQEKEVVDVDFEAMMTEAGITYPFEKSSNSNDNVDAAVGTERPSFEGGDQTLHRVAPHGNGSEDTQQHAHAHHHQTEQPDFGDTHNVSATNPNINSSHVDGDHFDWNAIGDSAWLDAELAGMENAQHTQQQPPMGDDSNMHSEIQSFTSHPTVADTSFQHGTQEIGETQVAEKVGGEFLEDLETAISTSIGQDQTAMLTPPTSTKKTSKSSLLGGLNLGSSILGKRKAASGSGDEEGAKTKVGKAGEES